MSRNLNYQPISNIKPSKMAPGTYCGLKFIPRSEFSHVSPVNPSTGTVYHATPKTGFDWRTAELPPTNRGITETRKYRNGNPYYEYKIRALIPFESLSQHLVQAAMGYEQFILQVERPSTLIQVIGDENKGATFTDAFDSGDTYSKSPGTYVEFFFESEDKCPFLIPEHGPGPVEPGGPIDPGGPDM